jgi:hypothetical protein
MAIPFPRPFAFTLLLLCASAIVSGEPGGALGPLALSVSTERGEGAEYEPGERMVVLVALNKQAWLRLYHRDAAGRVERIWPPKGSARGLLEAGTAIRIPGPRDRFELLVLGPGGEETLIAVASTRPFPEADPTLPLAGEPATVLPRAIAEAERGPPERAEARASYQVREASRD